MSDSTERFTGRAQNYQRYRQRYPAQQILEHLSRWFPFYSDSLITDVGAGTGMLSEVFLENGNPVIAIEPNPEMRSACTGLQQRFAALTIVDATAEATTLPDHSVEVVAAGRAFHWFNTHCALKEFRRIAKPSGWLVIVAQGRARNAAQRGFAAQAQAFERLLSELGTDHTYVRDGYRVHENLHELFPPHAAFHHVELDGTQKLDWESFRGQTMSLSMVPQAADPGYGDFQEALRRFFDNYNNGGVITNPTTCSITAAQLSLSSAT